ncbi:hypothetical protein GON26_01645 [Flavobacterium sp. GA093]|uniref:Uncharacterized protein n=1 Tax=Flavobacterium hydrocarbonoxydans TaxID=2683249 RepID=A0A6I4NJS4_9FLAO|nr:hypothetical protein [Flavobacterium hydrocarbonoxydans]MWB93052.1 hypothetical protein [Flavobacterium hydrocarbonoxydans]
MPDISLKLNNKILCTLTQNYDKSFTLEELTKTVLPHFERMNINNENLSLEREKQANVLDALIFLADNGLIFLNPLTDESSIKIS